MGNRNAAFFLLERSLVAIVGKGVLGAGLHQQLAGLVSARRRGEVERGVAIDVHVVGVGLGVEPVLETMPNQNEERHLYTHTHTHT